MNPGVLLIPYVLVLAFLAVKRSRYLITIWMLLYLVFPTTRNRFGSVSLYWCDFASIATLVAFFRLKGASPLSKRMRRWALVFMLCFSVGALSAFVRYGAITQPGYWVYRYILALTPLLVFPYVLHRDGLFRAAATAIVIAAWVVGIVAVLQSSVPAAGALIHDIYYGSFPREQPTGLRIPGMYNHPNNFAGGSALIAAILVMVSRAVKRPLYVYIGVMLAATAALLTYSRHGLLALAVLIVCGSLTSASRALKSTGVVISIVVLSSFFVSADFWAERVGRGVLADPNIQARIVKRPLELLDRLQQEPLVAVFGVGLGIEHTLDPFEQRQARYGFVSNTFALYLFYCGFAVLLVIVALFITAARKALTLPGGLRGVALGALGEVVVVLASDNYSFFHVSFPFMWSMVVAMIFTFSHMRRVMRAQAIGEAADRPRLVPAAPGPKQPPPKPA